MTIQLNYAASRCVPVALALTLAAGACGGGGSPPTSNEDPSPATLTKVAGDLQSAWVGRQIAPLVVVVADRSGKPVSGARVDWAVLAGGGTIAGGGPTTAVGRSDVSLTLGPDPGENLVEANVAGLSPVRFSATGIRPGTGEIAFEARPDPATFPTDIYVMNPDGSALINLTRHPADDGQPAWSPDRSRIAFKTNRDANYEVYVMNADGTGLTNLTNHFQQDTYPQWSPDGARIAFIKGSSQRGDIYVMNADGTNLIKLTSTGGLAAPGWSPDGTKIAFESYQFGREPEVMVMNADGTGVTRLTNDPFSSYDPAWSPDGSRIAFSTGLFNPGLLEIVLMNPGGTGVTRLAPHPGSDNDFRPAWSPDGLKIVYTCWRFRGSVVFSEVCTMDADGRNEVRLTRDLPWAAWPAWLK